MRTKNYFITSAALLLLASCSSELDVTQTTKVDEPTPVTFGAYSAQSTKTRAAIESVADLVNGTGFGVFAYYTGTDNYSAGIAPNFMYNEHVTGRTVTGGGYDWSYTPLKFWPNDIATGAVDGGGPDGFATGTVANGGKISFFAYAPYFENTPSNGEVSGATDGIISFTSNTKEGNPTVTYKVGSANFVDLLWGTAGENSVNYIEKTGSQAGTLLTDGKAKVWTNITRPKDTDRITFNFVHALSKFGGSTDDSNPNAMGGVRIMLNPDATGAIVDEKTDIERNTKVTIKSLKITSADESVTEANRSYCFYQDGTFDLATGLWTGQTTASTIRFSQTLKPTAGEGELALADDLKEVDSPSDWSNIKAGVGLTPKSVYKADQSPIYAVPGCSPKLTVTINYVVRTKDDKLSVNWTTAEQTIKKTITMPVFEINKAYGLLIRLGLTSVKFDATVIDWTDGGSETYTNGGNSTKVTVVDLPAY